jgi:hypothetical protein
LAGPMPVACGDAENACDLVGSALMDEPRSEDDWVAALALVRAGVVGDEAVERLIVSQRPDLGNFLLTVASFAADAWRAFWEDDDLALSCIDDILVERAGRQCPEIGGA